MFELRRYISQKLIYAFVITELACDPTKHADLAAVVMQEGLAHLCLITPNMTLVRAKIETNIPRKRKGMCQQHDKVSIMILHILEQTMLTQIRPRGYKNFHEIFPAHEC